MILSKTKERTLDAVETEGGIVLIERVRYVPHGYTKGKWNDDRVFLTAEELAKLSGAWPPKQKDAK